MTAGNLSQLKLFGKWDWSEVEVPDISLKPYINLTPCIVPHTYGRYQKEKFGRAKINIVERIINRMMVTGHEGKKHKRTSGRNCGKKHLAYNIVKEAFEIIYKRTKKNPIQVLINALINAGPREETTRIKYGGIVYHTSVDVSPLRRLDLAIRFICVGAAKRAFRNKKSISQALAEEIIDAANYNLKCYSISKKEEIERIARASR